MSILAKAKMRSDEDRRKVLRQNNQRTAWVHDQIHNTEYTPMTWENPEVFIFVQNSSIGQHFYSKANTTLSTFDKTALQQQLPTILAYIHSTHTLISNQFWVGQQAPQPFHLSFVVPTYMHNTIGLTRARNQMNRVSGGE